MIVQIHLNLRESFVQVHISQPPPTFDLCSTISFIIATSIFITWFPINSLILSPVCTPFIKWFKSIVLHTKPPSTCPYHLNIDYLVAMLWLSENWYPMPSYLVRNGAVKLDWGEAVAEVLCEACQGWWRAVVSWVLANLVGWLGGGLVDGRRWLESAGWCESSCTGRWRWWGYWLKKWVKIIFNIFYNFLSF